MLENNEKAILNISVPYLEVQCFTGTIQIWSFNVGAIVSCNRIDLCNLPIKWGLVIAWFLHALFIIIL